MCLQFISLKPENLPKESFTAYKAYKVADRALYSPLYPDRSNGTIINHGTHPSDVPDKVFIQPADCRRARLFSEEHNFPFANPNEYIGKDMAIAGFHCFAKLEDAKCYGIYWYNLLAKTNLSSYAVVLKVVSVQIHPDDIIAYGNTLGLTTYVVTKITITPEEFEKAFVAE